MIFTIHFGGFPLFLETPILVQFRMFHPVKPLDFFGGELLKVAD